MQRQASTVRFASAMAISLVFIVSGIAVGAAGDFLVIGTETNDAGTANTQLLTNSNVVAFKLLQNGPGTALMGYVTPTSGATRGVYGRSDSPNGDGVQARNGAASTGTGAGLNVFGGWNVGARVDSDKSDGLVATSGTCSTLFCGRDGVDATGYGFGAGVRGTGGAVGVYGDGGTAIGVYGAGDTWGVYSLGPGYVGGDLAVTGNADIDGNLNIDGTCTGCAIASPVINDNGAPLKAGDAVAIAGFSKDAQGRLMVTVRLAHRGDTVFGIVDAALTWQTHGGEYKTDTVGSYVTGGASAAPGTVLRVVTYGIVLVAAADASGGAIAAGNALVVSSTAGRLAKSDGNAAAGSRIGYALGAVKDGKVAVWVSPN